MPETPKDPFGQMDEGAVMFHEMYTGFVSAGFTTEQSFELTRTAVAEMMKVVAQNTMK